LAGRARGHQVEVNGEQVTIAAPLQGEAFVLVPPQAVHLHLQMPEGSARNVWRVRVQAIESVGPRSQVYLQGAFPLVSHVTPEAFAGMALSSGEEIWASVKATEVSAYIR